MVSNKHDVALGLRCTFMRILLSFKMRQQERKLKMLSASQTLLHQIWQENELVLEHRTFIRKIYNYSISVICISIQNQLQYHQEDCISYMTWLRPLTLTVHTPSRQSCPTKLWGWGQYGLSFVTQETTTIAAGPLKLLIYNI